MLERLLNLYERHRLAVECVNACVWLFLAWALWQIK
jgi:hypothetical protein